MLVVLTMDLALVMEEVVQGVCNPSIVYDYNLDILSSNLAALRGHM